MNKPKTVQWVLIAFSVLVVSLGAYTGVTRALSARGSAVPLAAASATATSAPTAQPVADAQAATTTAAAATSAATASIAMPTATVPPGYKAAWASKMTKQKDGTWMAPTEVLQQIKADFLELEKLNMRQTVTEAIASRPDFFRQMFMEPQLTVALNTPYKQYGQIVTGTSEFQFKNFSADGLSATMVRFYRGYVGNNYDMKTGKPLNKDQHYKDAVAVTIIRFDTTAKHWKIERGIDFKTIG